MSDTFNTKLSSGVAHDIPADLYKALTAKKEIVAKWESLTPLARNEWICWTLSVKQPETRAHHIERTAHELLEGKRRPCCWYGCIHRTDKAVSPSIQNIVLNKKRKKS